MDQQAILDSLDTEGAISLIMAYRTPSRFKGQQLAMDTGVESELRDVVRETVAQLRSQEMRVYEPDLMIAPGATFMHIPATMIADFARRPEDTDILVTSAERLIDIDNSLIQALMNVIAMDMISAHDVQKQGYNMYALVVGNDPNDRTIYIKHANPRKYAKPGRLMTALSDTLTRFEKPIFTFEHDFDIAISRHGLVVIKQAVFERTFRDVQALATKRTARVQTIARALPLDAGSLEVLATEAVKPIIANKLRAISENGHFNGGTVSVEIIRQKAVSCNIDPATILVDDKLHLEPATLLDTLKFLNDDVFVGAFTGQTYEAGSKSRHT